MPKPINPAKGQAMFEDYLKGMGVCEIAEKYQVSTPTVTKIKRIQEWDKKAFRAENNVVEYEKALHANIITHFLQKMKDDTDRLDTLIDRAFVNIMKDETYNFTLKDVELLVKLKLMVINTVSDGFAGPKLPAQNNITINTGLTPDVDGKLNSDERTQLYKIFNEARKKDKDKTTEEFVVEFQKGFPLDNTNEVLDYGVES